MLTLTAAARDQLLSLLEEFGPGALRISLEGSSSPLAPQFELALVDAGDGDEGDVTFEAAGVPVYLEAASAPRLEGAVVDFLDGAFELALAPEEAAAGADLATRIADVLERRVNPAVAAHGGRIALVGVRENVAYVRMSGGCQGCGLAAVTLRKGVERMLREAIPELAGVQDVTEHADGRNPFYAAK